MEGGPPKGGEIGTNAAIPVGSGLRTPPGKGLVVLRRVWDPMNAAVPVGRGRWTAVAAAGQRPQPRPSEAPPPSTKHTLLA